MRRSLLHLVALVVLAAVLALTPGSARAQAPTSAPADRAAQLKQQGDAAMESLHYADALGAYAQAYALSKDPALLYNEGRAQQALGNYPDALLDLERFAAEAPVELKARVPKLDELIADVGRHVAKLAIKCDVRGARILVRDKIVGTTPLDGPLALDAGFAALEVDAEGYEPYRRQVDLTGGAQTVLEIPLTLKHMTAVLRVSSTAASADVVVDGKPLGNAPVEAAVEPGEHKVSVHRAGFDDVVTTVQVTAGERKDVTLDPQKSAGIASKWWFWTGVGVVVVGAAVTTAALLIDKPHSNGDSFSPSTVSAPLRF
jgi:hypothetical protein